MLFNKLIANFEFMLPILFRSTLRITLRHTIVMFKRNFLTSIIQSSRRIPRSAAGILGASGALYCFFATHTINLDGQPGLDGSSPLSSLKRRKSTNSFDLSQPIDVESRLREHEESRIMDNSTGISRFDIVQVSR